MKTRKLILSILLVTVMLTIQINAQMIMDGDSTDWADKPIISTSYNNIEGAIPGDKDSYRAFFQDRSDIKYLKVHIEGNMLYYMIKFWGYDIVDGDTLTSWPSYVESRVENDTVFSDHRGDHFLFIDLDNDPTTGVSSHQRNEPGKGNNFGKRSNLKFYYDAGLANTDSIGAELAINLYPEMYLPYKPGNSDAAELEVKMELDGESVEIISLNTIRLDSTKSHAYSFTERNQADVSTDEHRHHFSTFAWGEDFLEVGVELTSILESINGAGYSTEPGTEWGVCARVSIPSPEKWRTDISGRGVYTLPEIDTRPSEITFDGDDSDWADVPILINDPDNIQGLSPWKVLYQDKVDIKEVKAFVNTDEDMFYMFNRMHYTPNENTPDMDNGPIWPNYIEWSDGDQAYKHKIFLKYLLDLDNNPATGLFNNFVIDGDTSAAYFWSTLGYYNEENNLIGADALLTLDLYISPWEGVEEHYYTVVDLLSGAKINRMYGKRKNDKTRSFTCIEEDTSKTLAFAGYGYNHPEKSHEVFANKISYFGHAWGDNFIELGFPLNTIREYFKVGYGLDVAMPGQKIKVAAVIETSPSDYGWAYEATGGNSIIIGDKDYVDIDNSINTAYEYTLSNNYPNPFNPSTKIKFSLQEAGRTTVKVFDMLGREVAVLVNKDMSQGSYEVVFQNAELASGLYFYQIVSGNFIATKKMMLIK